MTIGPGHNLVIQQSGAAQELTQHTNSPKPSPEQAAGQQQANELLQNTTVQEFDESEKLKEKKEKDALRRKRLEKKKRAQQAEPRDPDEPGGLLDTTV